MGTFGLGGLHRKSTWLRPVATFAQLPATTIDGAVVIVRDTDEAWEFDGATQTWVRLAPSPSGGFSNFADYTPSIGQTVFILPAPPSNPPGVLVKVNHVVYYPPVSFTVVGPTITWNNAFLLDPGDSVRAYY